MAIMLKHRYSLRSVWKKDCLSQRKAWLSQSNMKVMVVCFDLKGLVHYEFVPYGNTVKKEFCREVLRFLREAVCKTCSKNRLGCYNMIMHHLTCHSFLVGDYVIKQYNAAPPTLLSRQPQLSCYPNLR